MRGARGGVLRSTTNGEERASAGGVRKATWEVFHYTGNRGCAVVPPSFPPPPAGPEGRDGRGGDDDCPEPA
jgi:hypothetical protein